MRYSQLFTKTNKSSKEFESPNATYLTQGGFIDQTMAGVYSYLPLGLRVLNKIEQVIREEMNTIGVEVSLPALSPQEIWKKTDRLDAVDILFKAGGANERSCKTNSAEYILNPTHEEILVPIAQKHNFSYKDFPFAYYQIQTKFRNEARPKSGILRGREFRMKDLYSFHASDEDFQQYYEQAKEVYNRVFERLGIGEDTVIVLASGGSFTEKFSHEFQTKCDTGEDTIFYARSADTYYNKEIAPSQAPPISYTDKEILPREDKLGKGIIGVEELAEFLNIPVEKTTKTLLFQTDTGDVIAAAVRGGYDVNEEKLLQVVGCKSLELAPADVVKQVTGAEVGFAGVLDLPDEVQIYMDDSMQGRINFETGANKTDYHTINVNFGRDLPEPDQFYDFKVAKPGDAFPDSGEIYETFKASEVGNIFPLESKFSNAFSYYFTDVEGQQQPIIMGCYGIGSSRVMGVIVERYNDKNGIIWPVQVAPYRVHLIALGQDDESTGPAEKLYEELLAADIEVLYDDRTDIRAGAKFADADLIGIPYRIVISKKTLAEQAAELKPRNSSESQLVKLDNLLTVLTDQLAPVI